MTNPGMDGWIFVDGGTTRTRVSAVVLGPPARVLFHDSRQVGARDSARTAGVVTAGQAVEEMLEAAVPACEAAGVRIAGVVAAGMVTSAQGIAEVPHVVGPAGPRDLAAGLRRHSFARLPGVVVHLIPGVRFGPHSCGPEDVLELDVMRGEEVLALGCARLGLLPAGGGTLLSLGSHWKAIAVDGSGEIAASVSTLSGELLHAAVTTTVLASGLPRLWPEALSDAHAASVRAGAKAARQAGLARALYAVRLLELRGESSDPQARLAFALGAAVGSDEPVLLPAGHPVVAVGHALACDAWRVWLQRRGVVVNRLNDEDAEAAFRAGCLSVLQAAGVA